MGYRSEVAYIIRFENEEMRDNFINLQRAKADEHINTALNELVEVEDWGLGYHADHVKWYDDYPEIKAHHTLMDDSIALFNEKEDIAGWRFIRIGEDSDDTIQEDAGHAEDLYDYVDWYRGTNISFKRNTWNHEEGEEA